MSCASSSGAGSGFGGRSRAGARSAGTKKGRAAMYCAAA